MFSDRKLSDFRNKHQGGACFVCGLGPSLSLLEEKYRTIPTIGMEDIGLLFTPDYLTTTHKLKPRVSKDYSNLKQNDDIFSTVCANVFSAFDLPFKYITPIHIPRIMLDRGVIEDIFDENRLFQWKMGFIITISMALYLGFSRIGLIGIDFRGNRIVNSNMNLAHLTVGNEKFWKKMAFAFSKILSYTGRHGIKIYNLSPVSVITEFEKISIKQFMEEYVL